MRGMIVALAGVTACVAWADGPPMNAFFPFKNSMETAGPKSVYEQVAILKEIGFDGFDNRNLNDIEDTLKAVDQYGLKLFTVYFTVNIDPGEEAWNPRLPEVLPLMKDRGTVLWCNTHSKKYKPSDPAGDEWAVPLLQKLADLVAPFGVKVATYPHLNLWVESPEDTARLAEKVNRPNFGAAFNFHHWKALGDRALPLVEVVKRCAPKLFVMSINGAKEPTSIDPLQPGQIDEYCTVLKAFRDAGYTGPVGLQCYKITEDPKVYLVESMKVWKAMQERLAEKKSE